LFPFESRYIVEPVLKDNFLYNGRKVRRNQFAATVMLVLLGDLGVYFLPVKFMNIGTGSFVEAFLFLDIKP